MCMKVVHQNALQLLVSGFGPISARRTFQETSADIFSFRFRGQPRRNLIRFGKCAFKSLNIGSIKWALLAAIKTIEDAFAISSVWKLCSRKKSKMQFNDPSKVLLLRLAAPSRAGNNSSSVAIANFFAARLENIHHLLDLSTFYILHVQQMQIGGISYISGQSSFFGFELFFSLWSSSALVHCSHPVAEKSEKWASKMFFSSSAEKTFTNNSCGQWHEEDDATSLLAAFNWWKTT